MKKGFRRFSVLLLAMLVSVLASVTAFAASEKKMVTEQGGYVTVTNVVDEQKIEDIGNGDTILVVNAPATITYHGEFSESASITYWENEDKPVRLPLKDGSVTLTKPGNYGVLAVFGYGFGPDNSVMFAVKVTGDAASGSPAADPNPENKPVPKPATEPAVNQPAAGSAAAAPTASKVLVNGKEVSFEAYNIDGNNYFKLRDLAMAINGTGKNFEVTWDGAKNAINLVPNAAYTPTGGELALSAAPTSKDAAATSSKIYLNGQEVQLSAYNVDGNNYFKLRDIGKLFDFGITWDGTSNTVGIDTKSAYQPE